jgi:hypothetical protein
MLPYWDKLKNAALSAWDSIKSAWDQAPEFLSGIWNSIKESTRGIWESLIGPLQQLWAQIQPILSAIANDTIAEFLRIPVQLSGLWANTIKEFEAVAPYVQTALQNLAAVADWLSAIVVAPIINVFTGLAEAVRTGSIEPLVAVFKNLPAQLAVVMQGIYDVVVGSFSDAAKAVMKIFSNLGTSIGESLKSAVSGAWTAAKSVVGLGPGPAAAAVAAAPAAPAVAPVVAHQAGGLVSHPAISALAEKGIPEMVIPLQPTDRSKGLLEQTASMVGPRREAAAAAPVSVSAPISITINGVPAGQEGAVGREVQRAMQDPIRQLLDQIKAARAYESRSGYV